MYPGTKRGLASRKQAVIDRIRFIEDIGVRTVTVAHPLIAELVREASPRIRIQVSTVSHIDTVTQVKIWRERYGITSVCGNLLKNRSVRFLQREAAYCRRQGIELVLMVNEFCVNAGGAGRRAYGSHCIYRDSCFLCHAGNKSRRDDELFDGFPMSRCIASRRTASAWLKAFFIRPEDVAKYHSLGIDWFKITGRTGSTDYILKVAEAYLRRSWTGNLLGLWKPLETITSGQAESEFRYPVFVDNKALDGFVDFWFAHRDHDCSEEVCGETCRYCNVYLRGQRLSPGRGQ